MDVILNQLGELLLKAAPTFILVVLLQIYLKAVFFKPLEKVLHQRYEATEGARKAAEESLARAAAKAGEYEAALRAARSDIYKAQEQIYKQLQEKEAAQIIEARQRADAAIKSAKADIAGDVEAAKVSLGLESDALATQIAESILRRSAA
jgi:F0F1-type ATP synthase membrane subunit b/b'